MTDQVKVIYSLMLYSRRFSLLPRTNNNPIGLFLAFPLSPSLLFSPSLCALLWISLHGYLPQLSALQNLIYICDWLLVIITFYNPSLCNQLVALQGRNWSERTLKPLQPSLNCIKLRACQWRWALSAPSLLTKRRRLNPLNRSKTSSKSFRTTINCMRFSPSLSDSLKKSATSWMISNRSRSYSWW